MFAHIGLLGVVIPEDKGNSRIAKANIQIEVLNSFFVK